MLSFVILYGAIRLCSSIIYTPKIKFKEYTRLSHHNAITFEWYANPCRRSLERMQIRSHMGPQVRVLAKYEHSRIGDNRFMENAISLLWYANHHMRSKTNWCVYVLYVCTVKSWCKMFLNCNSKMFFNASKTSKCNTFLYFANDDVLITSRTSWHVHVFDQTILRSIFYVNDMWPHMTVDKRALI